MIFKIFFLTFYPMVFFFKMNESIPTFAHKWGVTTGWSVYVIVALFSYPFIVCTRSVWSFFFRLSKVDPSSLKTFDEKSELTVKNGTLNFLVLFIFSYFIFTRGRLVPCCDGMLHGWQISVILSFYIIPMVLYLKFITKFIRMRLKG